MTPQSAPSPVGRDLVVAVSPFEEPHAPIVLAAERAGALGLLDLGRDAGSARRAPADLTARLRGPFGVRVPVGCPTGPDDLPPGVDTVLLADPAVHPHRGDAATGGSAERLAAGHADPAAQRADAAARGPPNRRAHRGDRGLPRPAAARTPLPEHRRGRSGQA